MAKTFDERVYIIPLRREAMKAPMWRRSRRSIVAIKKFVEKNTRAKQVMIGAELNMHVWEKGAKNPPARVKVFVQNLDDDKVFVNLFGAPKKVVEKKEDKKKTEAVKKLEQLANKPEKKPEPKKKKKTTKKPAKKAKK